MNFWIAAPQGCLQYFRERSGTFTSFNWNPAIQRQYIRNQNYAIWYNCYFVWETQCDQMTILFFNI